MRLVLIALVFLVPVNRAVDVMAEQTGIMMAESIQWECTTDGECYEECLDQGGPPDLCSDWSYNSAGYLEENDEDDDPQTERAGR